MESKALGDFTIIKQIGQGALGTVFLAEHRFMKKQFVLKILPEELSSDRSFIQRFEEDVSLLASLDHPHIVKIHNVSFQQGQYFLVMDCVVDDLGEATNLAQYLIARGKRLEEETIFRILSQLADALDFAHGKRSAGKAIVHRNIKLNNILIAQGKSGFDVLLADFGLSRIVGTGAFLSRTYKMVAEALGIASPKGSPDKYPNPPHDYQKLIPLHASFLQNFAFLAPEQKRLDSPYPVDAKVDTYAFGVLTYYLLVGEFPDGIFDLPSARIPELQFNWDILIKSCLHADPRKRPELLIPALQAVRTAARAPVAASAAPQQAPVQPVSAQIAREYQAAELPISTPAPAAASVAAQHPVSRPIIQEQQPKAFQQPAAPLRPVLMTAELQRPETDPDPAAVFNIDTTVKHYIPEPKEVSHIQPLLTDMTVIEGGAFWRGSNDGNRDESPRNQITLNSFAIDVHPVTNEQFVRFLEVMGGEKDSNHQDIIRLKDSRIKRSGGKLNIESGYNKHPVVGVTWYGAIAYAKWVGKRLPTEAEWEIAALGGQDHAYYPTGEDIEKTQANFFSSDTTAVMSYAPNGYGLYDMAGNVYEWCHDWYGYNFYEISLQEPDNPKGPLQGVYRVLRGGCWKSLKDDLRCSHRHRNNPGTVNGTYGFRCAADVQ